MLTLLSDIARETKQDGPELISSVVHSLAKLRTLSSRELFLILRFVRSFRDQRAMVDEFFKNFYCNQWQGDTNEFDFFRSPHDFKLVPGVISFGKLFRGRHVVYAGSFTERKKGLLGTEFDIANDQSLIPLIVDGFYFGSWSRGAKQGVFLVKNNRNGKLSALREFIDDRLFGYSFDFNESESLLVSAYDTKNFYHIPILRKDQFQALSRTICSMSHYRDGLLDGVKAEYKKHGQLLKTSFFCCGVEKKEKARHFIAPSVFYTENPADPGSREWFYQRICGLSFDSALEWFGPSYRQMNSQSLFVELPSSSPADRQSPSKAFNNFKDPCAMYGVTDSILDQLQLLFPLSQNSTSALILTQYGLEEVSLDKILALLAQDGSLERVRIDSLKLRLNGGFVLRDLEVNFLEFVDCTLEDCVITVGETKQIQSHSTHLVLVLKNIKKLSRLEVAGVDSSDIRLNCIRIESLAFESF